MKQITCRYTIGKYRFIFTSEIEITSTWESLTDKAIIKVPRKLQMKGQPVGSELFARGDKVVIEIGYDYNFETLFTGYLARIEPGTPLVFHCEDAAYLLKQKTVDNYSKKSVTLRQLLTDICPVPFQCPAVSLGKFRIKGNVTVAQVLDELKKAYNLYSFIRDGVLYVGLPYTGTAQKQVKFNASYNIEDDSGLTYSKAEDVKVWIKIISMLPNNKKITWEDGDKGGAVRTIHVYDKTLDFIKGQAKAELRKLKFDGLAGSFTAFGYPLARHGDVVLFTDKLNPERSGRYLVKSVRYSFGRGGIRQEIEIDGRPN
jgi:hypothetical protein